VELIESSRLRLEPLSRPHADGLYAIYSEPGVRRFLLTCPLDRDHFERVFAHALGFATSHGMWAIVHKPTGELIGRVGFFAYGEAARPELAFLLSQPFWGQGLATEAALAAVRYGFSHHGWSEMVALVRPDNAAAIRVLAKLRMQREQGLVVADAPAGLYQVTRRAFEGGTEAAMKRL
jgi:RimJ/RimL family protein N-acetyltransferase